MELARGELAHPRAVVLRQRGDDDCADGDVDPHPEGVGAADDPQESALRERLDEASVPRQHARVVDADPRADEARQGLAEGGGEAESADRLRDGVTLHARGDLRRRQGLRALDRLRLGEVDDVHRRLALIHEPLDDLVDRHPLVVVVQRHRALDAGDLRDRASGALPQIVRDGGDVAERRRHQEELRAGEGQQRHLPRPPALGVAVVVELVHDDLVDRGIRPLSEGEVREDLGRAADDRRIGVHGGIPRDHADLVGAEDLHEREELLAHQGLDRRRVVRAAASGERGGVRRDGDERLAGAGRGGQDHVRARDQLDDGLVLGRIEGETPVGGPFDEDVVHGIRIAGGRREGLGQGRGHSPTLPVAGGIGCRPPTLRTTTRGPP